MPTQQQQAHQLREVLVPYIESDGTEQQVECRDGTIRRFREVRLRGFVLWYETPSHRNPRPVASCWDAALFFQLNPIEDYALTITCSDGVDHSANGKRTTMFSACWCGKSDTIHITSFADNQSRWFDLLSAVAELESKAAGASVEFNARDAGGP